jgi:hypothetical protein
MANFDEKVEELLSACEPTINLYKSFGWSAMPDKSGNSFTQLYKAVNDEIDSLVRDYKLKAYNLIIEQNERD